MNNPCDGCEYDMHIKRTSYNSDAGCSWAKYADTNTCPCSICIVKPTCHKSCKEWTDWQFLVEAIHLKRGEKT